MAAAPVGVLEDPGAVEMPDLEFRPQRNPLLPSEARQIRDAERAGERAAGELALTAPVALEQRNDAVRFGGRDARAEQEPAGFLAAHQLLA